MHFRIAALAEQAVSVQEADKAVEGMHHVAIMQSVV